MRFRDIERITKFITDNIAYDLTLKDIAKHMNYSEFHLSREFKKQTGYSIRQYIEALKVEKGIKALIASDEAVTDIAFDTGHKSPGTFSNTFKKHTGLSPHHYRSRANIAYRFLTRWIKKRSILTHYERFEKTDNKLTIKIRYPKGYRPKITCVGLFPTSIPKDAPIVGVATASRLEFTMENIPDGRYYLLACEVLEDLTLIKSYVLDHNYRAKFPEKLTFSGSTELTHLLEMRRPIESDPPITMNLPVLLMNSFYKKHNL
ncbi:MAG: AraC family transcriptional regulator [Peptostreptococcaceae bacterium]|nr:AraC family transcriptional regulator [Peptostreptococcaceae bacterium]